MTRSYFVGHLPFWGPGLINKLHVRGPLVFFPIIDLPHRRSTWSPKKTTTCRGLWGCLFWVPCLGSHWHSWRSFGHHQHRQHRGDVGRLCKLEQQKGTQVPLKGQVSSGAHFLERAPCLPTKLLHLGRTNPI